MAAYTTKALKTKHGIDVIIRSALTEDAKLLIALGKAIASEKIYTITGVDEIPSDISEEAKWIEKHHNGETNLLLVAEVDTKLIGICDFAADSRKRIAHTGYFGLGVAHEFRGQGIGELLLKNLLEWAKSHDKLEKVGLTVHADNNRAIALYKKLGFVEEGRKIRDLKYSDENYVDSILMALFVKPK